MNRALRRRPFAVLPTVLVAAVIGSVGLGGCGTVPTGRSSTDPSLAAPQATRTGAASAGSGGTCEYTPTGEAARPVSLPPTSGVPTSGTVAYVLKMTNGDVTITLDRAKAPCTVNSFESLSDQGYFNATKCHRLADSGIFILQCGDPTGTGGGGPGYQFANETDGTESYTSGVVAMANGGPGTNGSQFFIIWDDSTGLDKTPNYTIFGTIDSESRDVVASMAGEGQDGSNPSGGGRPNNPSEIVTATRK
ncbi:MAG TPA: peptidylprolyl isomerase [Propionibacteriaceae bacterium]